MLNYFKNSRLGLLDFIPFLGIILVHISGIDVDVMGVDAPQYAAMSREMIEKGSYLEITDRYKDYLDKPPFLFWITSLSFQIFDFSNFAYKLPSLLFCLLGVYATYRITLLFYNRFSARIAALFIASTQAYFLMTNDVRTDTILTGAIMFSIWQLLEFTKHEKWLNLTLGFVGIAIAMLTKGPLGLVSPALALGTHFVLKREIKWFFKWQWLVGLIIVGVLLSPMLYGLYQQFDLHPEKLINHKTGNSGIKFYFWEQSFGRLTGDNTQWRDGNAGTLEHKLFFVHTLLWMFLPWTFFGIISFIKSIFRIVRERFHPNALPEYLSIGGFIFPFIAMSISQYKLPHYIYVVLPFLAISAGRFVAELFERNNFKAINQWIYIQLFISALLWFANFVIVIYLFPLKSVLFWVGLIILFVLTILYALRRIEPFTRLIVPALISILAVNLTINLQYFKEIMVYQCYNQAGRKVVSLNLAHNQFYQLNDGAHSLDFYSLRVVPSVENWDDIKERAPKSDIYFFTDDTGLKVLNEMNLNPIIDESYKFFPISVMEISFLNPKTRESTLQNRYLVKI